MVTESEILAEAQRGELVCQLYEVRDGRPGHLNEGGYAKDRLCHELCERGLLRFAGWKGQRTSPFGMVSIWIKA